MQCAIIAGGMGTRLRPIIGDHPKPMVPLLGVPLLERLIGLCRRFGILDLHLFLAYRPDVIQEYFGDGAAFGVRITYWIETEPLGTAGCMVRMLPALREDLLVLYGDVFVEMDLGRLIGFHQRLQPAATLVVHPNDHPHDSDLVEAQDDRVIAFHRKPHPEGAYYANLVNAGAYVLTPRLLHRIPVGRANSWRPTTPPSTSKTSALPNATGKSSATWATASRNAAVLRNAVKRFFWTATARLTCWFPCFAARKTCSSIQALPPP